MRFDIDSRIEYIFNSLKGIGVDSNEESQIVEEIGYEAFAKIRDLSVGCQFFKGIEYKQVKKEDLLFIKQEYIKHKESYRLDIAGYDCVFFKQNSNEDVKDYVINQVVNEQMFYCFNPDTVFFNELCKLTTKIYLDDNGKEIELKSPEVEEKKEDIKKIVQQYIKNGYNPYNLMNQMVSRCNELKEYNKQERDATIIKNNQAELAQNMEICQIIENTENIFSPYKKVFETAECLGELINKSKELEKEEKFEEADKVNDEIENYKDKIIRTLKNGRFDMLELESILNGKAKYLRANGATAINDINRNMYYGLDSMRKIICFNKLYETKVEIKL